MSYTKLPDPGYELQLSYEMESTNQIEAFREEISVLEDNIELDRKQGTNLGNQLPCLLKNSTALFTENSSILIKSSTSCTISTK